MNGRIVRVLLWTGLLALLSGISFAQERWVYRYDGSGNDDDDAICATVASDGNIYAAGYTVGAGTRSDFTVVSLSSSGAERWVYRYDGPASSWDHARSIAPGSDGNLYAAGASEGGATRSDFTVVSLSSSGAERWVYRYDGPANDNDAARSIVMGSDGNLYAAGSSHGSGTWTDFTVLSLTSSGVERWVYRYDGSAGNYDGAHQIVMGSDGNVYAAGYSTESGAHSDFTVVSLSSSGAERWVYRYDGPENDYDGAESITIGSDGNLYAAGYSSRNDQNRDLVVVSLTGSGLERWVYRYDGPENDWDLAWAVTTGPGGDIYAAGSSHGDVTGGDLVVVCLSSSGMERWVYRYDGPPSGDDQAWAIATGPDGNIYAAGMSYGEITSGDLVVVCLSSSGLERWVYRYDGPGGSATLASCGRSIVTDSDGNIYVAGKSVGDGTSGDFTVVSLKPDTAEFSASLVTGGGWIHGDGSKKNFGFNAHSEDGEVWGQLQFTDHETKLKVHSEVIEELTVHGDTTASFAGVCRVDKASGYSFACSVEDRGEPGKGIDRFAIEIWDSGGDPFYSAGDVLGGGNIQIHTSADNNSVQRVSELQTESGSVLPAHPVPQENGLVVNSRTQQSYVSSNPFQKSTEIRYNLRSSTEARLEVYALSGKLVRTLVQRSQPAGHHCIEWNGTDASGRKVPTGVYIYRLTADDLCESGKIVLLK